MSPPWRGVVFQSDFRLRGGLPVLHLHGRSDSGETFLLRESRHRPYFYVLESDRSRVVAAGIPVVRTDRSNFFGEPVARVTVASPREAAAVRGRLRTAGIEPLEADIGFAARYLIDRGIRGGCEIRGRRTSGQTVRWIVDDPELRPARVEIEPAVLAFDIETDPAARRLLAISMHGCGASEVLVVDPRRRPLPRGARSFTTERDALNAFCERVRTLDPDVLTGWNVIDFDLAVLARIAAGCGHPLELGREPGAMRLRPARGYFGSGSATIAGRVVLDGIDLLRGAFVRMEDYSLDAVARQVLGEGKAVVGDARDRAGEIEHNHAHDLPAFVHYAATDARLALEILEKLKLVDLAFERSRLTGMMPDRVAASIASFDFLYLSELRLRGVVAPSVRPDDAGASSAGQAGGHVLEPSVGRHANVWVFDFKSLYPSIIRTLNIDPLGYCGSGGQGPDVIQTVSGACFRRDKAILPGMLDTLFPRREAAKKSGDAVASQAIKILMNSFYGVLGTPACRFYNPEIANAITGQGRHFLLWARRWFEGGGYRVLYGDTDSLFVSSGTDSADSSALRDEASSLAARLTADLGAYVRGRWRVDCHLELEFEKLYAQLFLPAVRRGTGGARKRYAGCLDNGEVEFVGMEVVRRDWTDLARTVQRELYARLFRGEPVASYLADVVASVRAGGRDGDLVYRKALRKLPKHYRAGTPPHVAAARKSRAPPGRIVSYVITVDGPEPVDNIAHELDREHYVGKQVRPVAEPVLDVLGLDFEQVIGDDRQISLF